MIRKTAYEMIHKPLLNQLLSVNTSFLINHALKKINMNIKIIPHRLIMGALLIIAVNVSAQNKKIPVNSTGKLKPEIEHLLSENSVEWNVVGPTSAQSMPIGNGDIGLNVWVEKNGDLMFYIGKTDSWGPDVKGAKGLMKLAAVRISFGHNQFNKDAPFLQSLKLNEGAIDIKQGNDSEGLKLRVWVDANNPVIRVEEKSNKAVALKVTLENWRLHRKDGDSLMKDKPGNIIWYHRNSKKADAHVANLTFGGMIKGNGLVQANDTTLQSAPARSHLISIYPLTAQTPTVNAWKDLLLKQVKEVDEQDIERTRSEHQLWWAKFWNRSWISIKGDQQAADATKGYILQRFISACAGRGSYPIKFNGSLFVVDNPELKEGKEIKRVDADYRRWGGQYWFQNTRPMYWPMLKEGDFEMMMPLFKMYAQMVINNQAQVKQYYRHEGAYFAETTPFWGGLKYWGPEVPEDWTGHYFTPILELSMMMLDYYEFTGDKKFAKELLVPVASQGLEFYDKHFGRDQQGKLLLNPVNAIEQFWKVNNPAPDIAGLHAISTRMLALPNALINEKLRKEWKRLQAELPELPVGTVNNNKTLLPYTGEQTAKPRNGENPELYAVYPFRLYGLGKPDLNMAVTTFNQRKQKQMGCWVQDPIQAALLGLDKIAKTYVSFNFVRKDPQLKFPAFWAAANDYAPDQDNGGCAQHGLQEMLMQTEGKTIRLFPAWPKEWEVDFKLNAPYKTTVEGTLKNGKLTNLKVKPASRTKDVVNMIDKTN
jgi:alpha-L-fucosidase 2